MAATYRLLYSEQNGFCTTGPKHINSQTTDGREFCWACPEAFGKGRFLKIQVRSGLDIWITDCFFEKEMVFSCLDHSDVLVFSFYLSGHASSCLGYSKYRLAPSPGQQGIFYFPQPVGYSRVAAQTVFRHIAIMVRPDQLTSYLEDDLDLLPLSLQQIIQGRSDDPFCQIRDLTPPMISALQQIIYCPYHGMTRRLYLESRVMALLAFQLEALSADAGCGKATGILHPADRRRMEQVRQLLVSDLENPPDLKTLTCSAGMSHSKLNQCFRQLYGMTVFAFLRKERLIRARQMIEREGFNVTETAYAVGYESISHFSQAYKKHFGMSPSRCRR
jgi:AraC-like DNA-binding protein